MQALTTVLKGLAAITVLVSLLHVLLGPGAEVLLGAQIPPEVRQDPVLDSQNRFYGMIFMGYGALLYLCSTNLKRHAVLLRILCAFIFAGGLARLLSMLVYGLPTAPVLLLTAIELAGVPLLLLWHGMVVARSR